ncbi:hypothetical protein [Xanthomonas phage DES1]|nr:hypothetical protein [Xanthomonas phage DES1]
MNKARVITTVLSVVVVYLSFVFVSLEWNPLIYSEAGRLGMILCSIAAPIMSYTCPAWWSND